MDTDTDRPCSAQYVGSRIWITLTSTRAGKLGEGIQGGMENEGSALE